MKKIRNDDAFTLVELLIAIGVMSIILAFAYPAFSQWVANSQYKEAVRGFSSILRDARAQAISTNFEHRVRIDMAGARFGVERGNRSAGSTTWTSSAVYDYSKVRIRGGETCESEADFDIRFFPNGSCDLAPITVCVLNSAGGARYKVKIDSTTSGRVFIE